MSIVNQIREKSIQARKAKDNEAASLLVTLLSEVTMVGKNANRETTDAEAVAVVRKFINNNRETLGVALKLDQARANALVRENQILEQFMPQQLGEYELKAIAVGRSNMPDFMKYLKEHFNGQYDGKLAAQVAKEIYQ